ncbi:glycosyltransferase family 4 protein [Sphingomonas bacterium]|uniref:glycosyltransferase family 4 protein n=1 Tax=Sphingomonas bacterium TaxID=1895847 RepID=UPI0015776E74|nr:glycosyltransferase family 1 protein [Sphingomonas bacterium]
MTAPVLILDLSRLLSRVLHATPTGVDRVEMAYAEGLLAAAGDRLSFAAVHPGGYGRLPAGAVKEFLVATKARWQDEGAAASDLRWFAVRALAALRPRPVPRADGTRRVYIQASPHHLTRPLLVERILARERARFLCLVHDLIPLEFPEYARPGGAQLHRCRVETIARYADGVLGNSTSTLHAMRPWLDRGLRAPATGVAPLGTECLDEPMPVSGPMPGSEPQPYFICVGTIEPRKNHLLLLNIWRRIAAEPGTVPPRLLLVGRRGWENEQVVDMLERCPALVGCVEEHSRPSDREMRRLVAGARALLMPSFAEGYGMPVTEALALGVPVICSDIPAHRETGGTVPDYLDPLDAIGWMRAIRAYAADGPERRAQFARMPAWSPPTWREHMDMVLAMAEKIAS